MRKPRVNARLIEIARKIEKLPDFDDHLGHLSCIYCREWWVNSHKEMEQENRSMKLQLLNLREVEKTMADFQRAFVDERKRLYETIDDLKRRLRKRIRRR